MDRRNFFKTILAAPLITPILMASKHHQANAELFLIADEPQRFISPLLSSLAKDLGHSAGRFVFLNEHPREMELRYILTQSGWRAAKNAHQADLAFSFSFLQQNARPSFSLVQGGKIQDIRTDSLLRLWRKMNQLPPSLGLTTATFKQQPQSTSPAEAVSVYQNGQAVAKLSLQTDTERSFPASLGQINVRINHGSAIVSESSCRFQICRHTAPITLPGERIICAPNHFLLEIDGPGRVDTIIG